MNKPKLILLKGGKRQGKDSLAEYIGRNYLMECEVSGVCYVAIAEPIKEKFCEMFGVTLKWLEKYKDDSGRIKIANVETNESGLVVEEMEDHKTPRHFLEKLGNEFTADMIGKFGWCNMAARTINQTSAPVTILTDMRLTEEHQFFKTLYETTHDITVIHVVREGWVDPAPSTHRTNTEWKLIPHDIECRARDLDDLQDWAEQFVYDNQ